MKKNKLKKNLLKKIYKKINKKINKIKLKLNKIHIYKYKKCHQKVEVVK